MGFNEIFWIFITIMALQPVLRQKFLNLGPAAVDRPPGENTPIPGHPPGASPGNHEFFRYPHFPLH